MYAIIIEKREKNIRLNLSAYEHANMKRDTKKPDDISLVLFIHLFIRQFELHHLQKKLLLLQSNKPISILVEDVLSLLFNTRGHELTYIYI